MRGRYIIVVSLLWVTVKAVDRKEDFPGFLCLNIGPRSAQKQGLGYSLGKLLAPKKHGKNIKESICRRGDCFWLAASDPMGEEAGGTRCRLESASRHFFSEGLIRNSHFRIDEWWTMGRFR